MAADENKNEPVHYIDAEEFTDEMTVYSHACRAAKKTGAVKPDITPEIGKKFLMLAENLGDWYKFRNYTFIDEMIGDAIENMIRYAHNFDPDKVGKSGAFSYFTRFAYYAFLRRIAKEDKQYRTKVKFVQSYVLLDMLPDDRQDHDTGTNFENKFIEYLFEYYDAEHEKKDTKPKKAAPVKLERGKTFLEKRVDRANGNA